MVTAGLCAWVAAGMVLDAWAHQNLGQLETFFTPWHAVLYSGLLAVMAWLGGLALAARRLRPEGARVPVGYGLGLVGAAVFALSGTADAAWHTVFGIEQNLEAALSPPHLGLFLGALLVFTTPLRSAWLSDRLGPAPPLWALLPALVSLGLTTLLVSFLLFYLSALREPMAVGARPALGYADELGVAGVLVTNLLLIAPVLLLLRRWRPPFGSVTILFGMVSVLTAATREFAFAEVVVATLVAGLVADGLMVRVRSHRLVATIAPLVLWTSYFIALELGHDLAWPAELWMGSIVFASLGGLALSLLMEPTGR
jgi:hypothetical protein